VRARAGGEGDAGVSGVARSRDPERDEKNTADRKE
jgi:hypothetical protein